MSSNTPNKIVTLKNKWFVQVGVLTTISSQPTAKAEDISSQYSGSFSTDCREKANETKNKG